MIHSDCIGIYHVNIRKLWATTGTLMGKERSMSLNDTSRGNRLHIGIFGRRNSGKSSLVNALTGQELALVSDTPGTTTDPVFKSMELHPVGPVVFIDTAGFDDEGELGMLRVSKTEEALEKTDVGIVLLDDAEDAYREDSQEYEWISKLQKRDTPVIKVLNKCDIREDVCPKRDAENDDIIRISAKTGAGLETLRNAITESVPEDYLRSKVLGNLAEEGSLAVLVMPQDIQAPKGRLILPQVQTLRELLDKKCTAVATTADGFERTLKLLNKAPDLIITDSQCFREVYEKKPEESALTSFSVLFAAYKGDIGKFVDGASLLDDIIEKSKDKPEDIRILIAEACTHVPLTEDIGTIKIPRMLRKLLGEGINIDNVRGSDFPPQEELGGYDLIIHCGACMFNRKHVLNRIAAAEAAGVPITNYGVILAKLTGILDKITLP